MEKQTSITKWRKQTPELLTSISKVKDIACKNALLVLKQRADEQDKRQAELDERQAKLIDLWRWLETKDKEIEKREQKLRTEAMKIDEIMEKVQEKFGIENNIDADDILDRRQIFEYIKTTELSNKIMSPSDIKEIFETFFEWVQISESTLFDLKNKEINTTKWVVRKIKKFTHLTIPDEHDTTGQPICIQIPPTFVKAWKWSKLHNGKLIEQSYWKWEEVPLNIENFRKLLQQAKKQNKGICWLENEFFTFVTDEMRWRSCSGNFSIYTSWLLKDVVNATDSNMFNKRDELFENWNHKMKWDYLIAMILYQLYTLTQTWKWVVLLRHWWHQSKNIILDEKWGKDNYLTVGAYQSEKKWTQEYEIRQHTPSKVGSTMNYASPWASYEFEKRSTDRRQQDKRS